MYQPESLRTDDYLSWSRGRGNDVWGMLKAAADGDVETLQDLAKRQSVLVDCEFEYRRPLYFAVLENRVEAAEWLLNNEADPMCGGLGYQPAYKPASPGNLPWPLTLARERGYDEMSHLLETALWTRFQITPSGEILPGLIRDRDWEGVERTLDERPELLDFADGFGNKPIHWAAMTRRLPLIDRLLERGADVNSVRPDGARPLDLTNGDYHYRGWRDVPRWTLRPHEVVIGYLLARGAYYDVSTAAQLGDLERVRELLAERPGLVNEVPDSTGYYNGAPLRCAAGNGHFELVKLLLERGADPNLPEPVAPQGGALYEAIAGEHWEVVRLLLAHGANAEGSVESSGNCYWRAKRDGAPPEILQLLASHGGSLTVELASYDGDVETLSAMLSANPGLAVHEHLPTDDEAILELVMRYQPEVLAMKSFTGAKSVAHARWLLERGVDAVRPDWLGVTPLHRFALAGNTDAAALCLEYGADLDAWDHEFSSTPLGWAARAGKKEMVDWLLNQGANPNLPIEKPWAQPLAWARRWKRDDVVSRLEASRPSS